MNAKHYEGHVLGGMSNDMHQSAINLLQMRVDSLQGELKLVKEENSNLKSYVQRALDISDRLQNAVKRYQESTEVEQRN